MALRECNAPTFWAKRANRAAPDRDGTAEGLPGQLQPGAAAQIQHGLGKDAADDVDVIAEVPQNLPSIFRGVFEGDDLEFDVRTALVDLRPKSHQQLCGRHGRRADTDDVGIRLHGVLRPGHRVPAVLDDILGVLIQGTSG